MTRELILVAVSLFTWGLGEGMFTYFQTLYLQEWGANPLQIGVILSIMGVAMMLAQTPAGYLADKTGPRPVMWASWLLGTAAAWMMALAGTMNLFIIGMLVYGLTSFVLAPMNSYITAVRGKLSTARALTITSAAFSFGAAIGPIIGGSIAEASGLKTVYLWASVVITISTLLILPARNSPREVHTESEHPGRLWNNQRFLLLLGLSFVTLFALYLPQPLTPNYLQNQRGFTYSEIGLMGTIASLSTAMTALALGNMYAPLGYLVGLPMMAIFSLFIWRGNSVFLSGVGYALIGGYRLTRLMLLAIGRSLIHPDQTGLAFGLIETVNAGTIILAPLLAGFLYEKQPTSIYPVTLVLLGAVLLLNLFLLPGLREFRKIPSRSPFEENEG